MDRVIGKVLAALVIAVVTPIVWGLERWAEYVERNGA